jgi:hypothetical protein
MTARKKFPDQDIPGTTYLLHIIPPYKHARNYVGFAEGGAEELERRLAEHGGPKGARLLQVAKEAGHTWKLARIWPSTTRKFERQLKDRRAVPAYCPDCRPERNAARREARKTQREKTEMDRAEEREREAPIVESLNPAEAAKFVQEMEQGYQESYKVHRGHSGLTRDLAELTCDEFDTAFWLGQREPGEDVGKWVARTERAEQVLDGQRKLSDELADFRDGKVSRDDLMRTITRMDVIAPKAVIPEPETDYSEFIRACNEHENLVCDPEADPLDAWRSPLSFNEYISPPAEYDPFLWAKPEPDYGPPEPDFELDEPSA